MKDYIISLPLNLVPFLNNNDGTRLQMSSNQMRQAISLIKNEKPIVRSGLEDILSLFSDLNIVSPNDGIILYIDKNFIALKLHEKIFDNDIKIIPLNIFYEYEFYVQAGQEIKKGNILASARNQNIVHGTNLLTAITPYYGFNYEDAIVISKSCFEKLTHEEIVTEIFTFGSTQIPLSLSETEYKPFLEEGEEFKSGDLLFLLKNADISNMNEIIMPPLEKRAAYSGKILKTEVYVNSYYSSIRELSYFLEKYNEKNTERLNNIFEKICKAYNSVSNKKIQKINDLPLNIRNQIEHLSSNIRNNCGKWKYKNVTIEALVKYTIKKKSFFKIGDKLANRHGNKGTVSLIVPDEEILKINGKPIDIIINIMGITSRMNIGQIYELWASNVVEKVKNTALEKSKIDQKDAINFIADYYNTIDKTEKKEIYNSFNKNADFNEIIDNLCFISPPFDSPNIFDLYEIMKKYNVESVYKVLDPASGDTLKIPVGYMFWQKLHHFSEEKIAARSFGSYNKKTLQPLSGKKNKGGQRFGEMEVWSILGHDALKVMQEILGLKSDDLKGKYKALNQLLKTGSSNLIKGSNRTSEIFRNFLNALGLDFKEEP